MKIFVMTFVLFLLAIAAMAVGYVFKRRTIKGSCGGIAALGMEKVCDCDTPCARRRAELARQGRQA